MLLLYIYIYMKTTKSNDNRMGQPTYIGPFDYHLIYYKPRAIVLYICTNMQMCFCTCHACVNEWSQACERTGVCQLAWHFAGTGQA